jgi:hypothetical protein
MSNENRKNARVDRRPRKPVFGLVNWPAAVLSDAFHSERCKRGRPWQVYGSSKGDDQAAERVAEEAWVREIRSPRNMFRTGGGGASAIVSE